jgi:hypothetical protein
MMRSKKGIALLVTSALVVVGVFGAMTYRAVYAQSATPTPATPSTQAQPLQPGPGRGGGPGAPGGAHGGYSDADLASALGITTDQLGAAEKTANSEALAQAVSQGLITQAQADQLSANGFDQRRFRDFGVFGPASSIDYNALLAKALNISPSQLQAAYQTAANTALDAQVANGNLTQAQTDAMKARNALANDSKFQAAMKSAYQAGVQQAVTDGVITQAQADALSQEQSQQGNRFFGLGGGHGMGGPGFGPGN